MNSFNFVMRHIHNYLRVNLIKKTMSVHLPGDGVVLSSPVTEKWINEKNIFLNCLYNLKFQTRGEEVFIRLKL